MAYNITLTNGQNLLSLADGTTDTNFTSLTLIGKNFAGYGAFLNQNYVKMLENFSNSSAPPNPLQGQLYWNSTNKILNVWNGTGWKTVSSSTSSATAPTSPIVGDLWWDIANGQLKVADVGAPVPHFTTIGPAYTVQQGDTGIKADTILDVGSLPHIVVRFTVNNVLVAILSKDASFTAQGTTGFTTINPGFNLATQSPNLGYYGDANNALNLGGVAASNYLRNNQPAVTSFPLTVNHNNGVTVGATSDFNIGVTPTDVNLTSLSNGKNLNMYVNVSGFNTKVLTIDATNGAAVVLADPTLPLGVATKQYVDNQLGGISSPILLRNGTTTITGTLYPDTNATHNFGSPSATFNNMYATTFNGTATNATALGGIAVSSYVRNNLAPAFTVPVSIVNNTGLTVGTSGDLAVDVTTTPVNAVNIRSKTANKSMDFYVNDGVTPAPGVKVLSFDGATGLGTVKGNPTATYGIATRDYVLSQLGGGTGINISSITGSLIPNTNNVYNVGSNSARWNTMFATTFSGNASTANYADLAERFEADAVYTPGTVVELGGVNEITAAVTDLSENVFGVISTNAAYLMNAAAGDNNTHPPVALQGRVPVRVIGLVNKGDRLVSAGNGLARAASRSEITPYNVIGRALANKTTTDEGTVEAIVKLNT